METYHDPAHFCDEHFPCEFCGAKWEQKENGEIEMNHSENCWYIKRKEQGLAY